MKSLWRSSRTKRPVAPADPAASDRAADAVGVLPPPPLIGTVEPRSTGYGSLPSLAPAGTVIDAGAMASAEVRAASVCGTGHRHSRMPRQDAYALAEVHGHLVAAVADGVSAAARSDLGAALAARIACELLVWRIRARGGSWLPPARSLFRSVAKRMVAAARTREPSVEPADLSTTLTVVVLTEADGRGDRVVWSAGVGNSEVRLLANGRWMRVGAPTDEGDGLVSEATEALPASWSQPVCRQARVGPGDVVVLMTDGIGTRLGSGLGSLGRHLAPAFRTPPEPLEFAWHISYRRRGDLDDRTAVAIWPLIPEPNGVRP